MSNAEIIINAIGKATKNGFKLEYLVPYDYMYDPKIHELNHGGLFNKQSGDYVLSVKDIILSHDFAKAFWGEHKWKHKSNGFEAWFECSVCKQLKHTVKLDCWQYHLQQMVISEDIFKYLEQFV